MQQQAAVLLGPRPNPSGTVEYVDFRWADVGEVLELAGQSSSFTDVSRGDLGQRILVARKRLKELCNNKGIVLGGEEVMGEGALTGRVDKLGLDKEIAE